MNTNTAPMSYAEVLAAFTSRLGAPSKRDAHCVSWLRADGRVSVVIRQNPYGFVRVTRNEDGASCFMAVAESIPAGVKIPVHCGRGALADLVTANAIALGR